MRPGKFVPAVVDTRHCLGEFHYQDVRIEWISDAFRRAGIVCDFDPITKIDETFRPANMGGQIEPPMKIPTGHVRAMVPAEDKDRAMEILAKLR